MSAMSSTATTGRTSHVSPLAAAVALAGILAVSAVGLAISQGIGTSSTVAQPAAGPAVVSGKTMSGPQTAAQKGLGPATPYGGSDFGAQYAAWLAAQNALAADFPDYFQRIDGANGAAAPVVERRLSNHPRIAQ